MANELKQRALFNPDLIQQAVASDFGKEAHFESYEIEDFLAEGENFGSTVTSIKVSYRNGGKKGIQSYIIKYNAGHKMNDKYLADLFHWIYKNESLVLATFVEKLNLELKNLNQDPIRAPKYYAHCSELDKEFIVEEDLRNTGFVMFDKFKPMDLEHSILVVKELGRLHAASILIEDSLPGKCLEDAFPDMQHPLFCDKDWIGFESMGGFMSGQLLLGKEIYTALGGQDKEVEEWINNKKTFFSHVWARNSEPSGKFNVLIHGDCWSNNMLFKYDEANKPVDFRLLDFQFTRKGSPAADLTNFFYASLSLEDREKYKKRLLVEYYMSFTNILLLSRKDIPFDFLELEEDFDRKFILGFLIAVLVQTTGLVKPERTLKIEEMGTNDASEDVQAKRNELINDISQNPVAKKRFLDLFHEASAAGLFKTTKRTIVNHYPAILKENLVEEVLKLDVGDTAKLLALETRKFTELGDNYCSAVISIQVHYEEAKEMKKTSYVCKLNPGNMPETFAFIYAKEYCFFKKILPALNKELKELELPKLKTPVFFAGCNEMNKEVLITNNLKTDGFKMANRMKSLDLEHASLVMIELGRIHASSLLLEHRIGDFVHNYYPELVDPKKEPAIAFQKMVSGVTNNVIQLLELCTGYDHVIQWLKKHKDEFSDIFMTHFVPEEKFNVLLHGDCWTNNMLFKYGENGKPIDIRFVDFQIVREMSAAIDLNYFFYSSLDAKMRQKYRNRLLVDYYQSFSRILLIAGQKIPFTFQELLEEVKDLRIYGCSAAIFLLPLILIDKEGVTGFDVMSGDKKEGEFVEKRSENNKKYLLNNQNFKDRMLSMFDELVEAKIII